MQVTSQTTVAAPIEVVWDTLTDHVGMMGWGPGVTVTMDRPGTADANGVGAVRRIATPGPGPDIVEEVVTFEPPNVMGYKALSGTPFPVTPARCGSPRRGTARTSTGPSRRPHRSLW